MNTTPAAPTAGVMRLRLDLRDGHGGEPGTRTCIELEGRGASIGRGANCDWQLQAAGVSRLHASVRHLDGVYFLEDHSTNGMLHNGAPLRRGFPAALRDGDRVQIDLFEIAVTLLPLAAMAETGRGVTVPPTAVTSTAPAAFAASKDAFAALAPSPASIAEVAVDPLALFATSYTMEGATAGQAGADWNHAPALADSYRARASAAAPPAEALLPEHWDRTRSEFLAPPSAAVPAASTVAAAEPPAPPLGTPLVPAVDTTVPPSPTAADPHALLVALVAGLMDVLRARAELKNSLRLPATLIQRRENNPLKFAATAEEAVARLLAPSDPAYLGGAAAIDDALHDIGQHQLALMAGMRAAFEHTFAHFDPARFESESAAGGGLAAWTGRPWRQYLRDYRSLQTDPDERFRRLFGDAFGQAYEEQLLRAREAAPRSHWEPT